MTIGGKKFIDIVDINSKKNNQIHKYFYVNGREAFASILKKIYKKKKKLYVPNYICSSLLEVIKRFKFEISFYDINDNLDISIPSVENSIILVINYFGKKIKINKRIIDKNIIIEDVTLSIDDIKNKIGLKKKNYFYYGSLRKIFTSLICGFSSVKNQSKKVDQKMKKLYLESLAASNLRDEYNKNYNYLKKNEIENYYLNIFEKLEIFFANNLQNNLVDKIFLNYFSNINFKYEKFLRKKNYNLIKINLQKKIDNKFINDNKFSFFIFLTKKKKKIFKFLKKYNI